jgi:hypothetical protein
MAEPGKWETWQVSEFWDAWNNSYGERQQKAMAREREDPDNLNSITTIHRSLERQTQEVGAALEKGLPLEPLLESYGLAPVTVAEMLPESQRVSPAREVKENSPIGQPVEKPALTPEQELFAKLKEAAARNQDNRQQTREQGQDRDR